MSDEEKTKRIHKLLYSCTDREEVCRHAVEVEELCEDAIAVVIGWGWARKERLQLLPDEDSKGACGPHARAWVWERHRAMTYEECAALVDSYASAVVLSNSADLTYDDCNEVTAIRDTLGEFIATLLFYYLEDRGDRGE